MSILFKWDRLSEDLDLWYHGSCYGQAMKKLFERRRLWLSNIWSFFLYCCSNFSLSQLRIRQLGYLRIYGHTPHQWMDWKDRSLACTDHGPCLNWMAHLGFYHSYCDAVLIVQKADCFQFWQKLTGSFSTLLKFSNSAEISATWHFSGNKCCN